jgi:hypothetical protein
MAPPIDGKKMEQSVYFFQEYQLLPKFLFVYITYFFFYGYVCLAGTIGLSVILAELLRVSHGAFKFVSFALLLPIGYAFVRFILILATTRYKWRFYRISYYRLQKKGFSESYFKYEMYEPCMRLIVKRLLKEFGFQKEYKEMLQKYIKVNQRMEDAKNRLLESVVRDNETKSTTKEVKLWQKPIRLRK